MSSPAIPSVSVLAFQREPGGLFLARASVRAGEMIILHDVRVRRSPAYGTLSIELPHAVVYSHDSSTSKPVVELDPGLERAILRVLLNRLVDEVAPAENFPCGATGACPLAAPSEA